MTELQDLEENKPKEKYLKDYKKPDFSITSVYLTFELNESQTLVSAEIEMKRETEDSSAPLILNGERLKLLAVMIDGKKLDKSAYMNLSIISVMK